MREARCQGRRLLNIELFCETLATSRLGINRFLTAVSRCLCIWMSRLPKYMELRTFPRQQEMKLRLFHLMIVSLAPATRFLLSSRHAIRRSVWFSRGLYFKLCRPRLNDEHAAEVLVIPGRSMLAGDSCENNYEGGGMPKVMFGGASRRTLP